MILGPIMRSPRQFTPHSLVPVAGCSERKEGRADGS
jgi:hypothetical protein